MKRAFEATRLEPAAAAGRITASMAAVEAPIELTIIVPMFNEAPVLDRLFERLGKVMERLGLSYEIIVVDDGSTDDTLAGLLEHRARNPAIKVLSLSRTFGKDIALSAGLDCARGRAVVPLDADLQDPPELIEQMVDAVARGLRRGLRDPQAPARRHLAQAHHGAFFLPRLRGDRRRADSARHRRFPPARSPRSRRDDPSAGTHPFHEGAVRLGRLQADRDLLPTRGAPGRRHQVELLAPVELRGRRDHLVQLIPAQSLELLRLHRFRLWHFSTR